PSAQDRTPLRSLWRRKRIRVCEQILMLAGFRGAMPVAAFFRIDGLSRKSAIARLKRDIRLEYVTAPGYRFDQLASIVPEHPTDIADALEEAVLADMNTRPDGID